MALRAPPACWPQAESSFRPRFPIGSQASSRGRAGMRIGRAVRDQETRKRTSFHLSQRPGLPSGFRAFLFSAFGQRSVPAPWYRIAGRQVFFNKMPRGSPGTGRWRASPICGCSSVGRARPCQGRGHGFEPRHPLHLDLLGCARVPPSARCRGNGKTGCAWGSSPCAARAPGRLAGHSRTDTAEESFALVAQLVVSTRLVSGRSRVRIVAEGTNSCRVRLAGLGRHPFKVRTRVRVPYTTPDDARCGAGMPARVHHPVNSRLRAPSRNQTRSFVISRARRKPAAKIGRPRNSSPGVFEERCPRG
jgi:hypothetical protein